MAEIDSYTGPQLPADPDLRDVAIAIESAGLAAEIVDDRFRLVFISSEEARVMGCDPATVDQFYRRSMISRQFEFGETWQVTEESGRDWWRQHVPIMRHYLDPDDVDFGQVFGEAAGLAEKTQPSGSVPRAWFSRREFARELDMRANVTGDMSFLDIRINDDKGCFVGVVSIGRIGLPESLLFRLGRGDRDHLLRMDAVREPARRQAAILFADLEASGDLSRRLSSRGFFDLIRDFTDLIDAEVVDRSGILGKHAGDGASALFLAESPHESEPDATRSAVEAAKAIRVGVASLGPADLDVRANVGLHWGATLMVGQVATSGRLEVTALGDQMNECARIEGAARGGQVLASKDLLERLDGEGALATGIDPSAITYLPLGELEGAGDKAIRDAGAIPVALI